MKKIFLFFVLCLVANAKAQTYTIPWAQQQPAWVFPIWIENGDGQKDTLYYCYQQNAIGGGFYPGDSIFGEVLSKVDTNSFYTYYSNPYNTIDSFAKCYVGNLIGSSGSIFFSHPIMPIILRWDINLFYSDSLPFQNNFPTPRAQGLMFFDLPMWSPADCFYSQPILITDSINPSGPVWACVRQDSIEFENQFGGNNTSYIDFSVIAWSGTYGDIDDIKNLSTASIYPNPTQENINIILSDNEESFEYIISDLAGKEIVRGKGKNEDIINIDSFSNGIYFISINEKVSKKIFHLKIFKQ
ncbi:MAG: T9SS type A sorting domain-containing protein [Bacteroidota bacterium]